MARRLLVAVAVLGLVALSGCSGVFGPEPVDEERLSQEASYEWDTDRDAYIEINRENYTAVYNVSAKTTGDEDTIEFYETNVVGIENGLILYGLQYRYPNGTMVRYLDGEAVRVPPDGEPEPVDALAVDRTRQRTIVSLPADEGQLAFTTDKTGKQVTIEPPVHGSYTVVLPPNTDVALPLLAQVQPAADDRDHDGDRVRVHWGDMTSSVLIVRWYLDRDILLFGGLSGGLAIAGVIGLAYYYVQIKRARHRREEVGLDVDPEELKDDRDGPPPGMR